MSLKYEPSSQVQTEGAGPSAGPGAREAAPRRRLPCRGPSSSLLLSSLELIDTNVYESQIRARLGTAAHFCEVVEVPLFSTF